MLEALSSRLHTQHPEEEEDGEEKEERILPVVVPIVWVTVALVIPHIICSVEGVVSVEHSGEEAKGEGPDAKGHMEPRVTKTTERSSTLRFGPLALRSWRRFQSGVFLATVASAVEGDDFVSTDTCFTHWTLLPTGSRLQPLVQARPAEKVSAQADDRVSSCIQTNIALERRPVALSFALTATPAWTISFITLLPKRNTSTSCPAVVGGPRI